MPTEMTSSQSAPYPPTTASIGGTPTVGVDVPICSVFMFLFLVGAASHMTILQLNLRKGHKFMMSGMLFGFCFSRIVTNILRIIWACYPTDVRVAIAAQIFVAAGVLILFLVNLIFAQRIIRAAHPHFSRHRALHYIFMVLYALILFVLAMNITSVVDSFYTLSENTKRVDLDLQRAGSTYTMFVSFLPIPMVILGLIIPRKTRLEKFGKGSWRTKVRILLASSVLLCLGASFRLGTMYKNPRPRNDPAWYDANWCFYFFNFTLEIIVVYLYFILRVDQRFHVPNGSHGSGDYGKQKVQENERPISARRIMSEEEVFDDEMSVEKAVQDEEAEMHSEASSWHSPTPARGE